MSTPTPAEIVLEKWTDLCNRENLPLTALESLMMDLGSVYLKYGNLEDEDKPPIVAIDRKYIQMLLLRCQETARMCETCLSTIR